VVDPSCEEGTVQQHIETFIELVQEDRLVRWATIAGVGLLWLSVAWLHPGPLLLLALLALGTAWMRKHRRPFEPETPEELF
jgi:hypothetical protein